MKVGLIAHDEKKRLMQDLCVAYKPILRRHELFATETTGRLVEEATGLRVHKFLSGHIGGMEQFGAALEENTLDMVIFLRDPEHVKSHIKMQRINLAAANRELDVARDKLTVAMQERKTHDKLKEKQFEQFRKDEAAKESKEIDELVSYRFGNDVDS